MGRDGARRASFVYACHGFPTGLALGASFFLSLGDASRNGCKFFFTTISRCFAQRLPLLKAHITRAVELEPQIGTKNFRQQFDKLILEPLSALGDQRPLLIPVRLVVVIEALDGCPESSEVEAIIELLGRLTDLGRVQVRVLVTSRSYPHIGEAMAKQQARVYILGRSDLRWMMNRRTISPDFSSTDEVKLPVNTDSRLIG